MKLLCRCALWLLILLPAACSSSPNPSLYTLAVIPGETHGSAPPRVELRAISLARYLERSPIVRSSEDFRLDILANDWWGEPLDAMLSRVVVQELSQRLPGSTVFPENGAITAAPDASIELNIQRFDEDRSGAMVLDAQVAVAGRTTATRSLRLSVTPPSSGTPGVVSAMSTAAGQLADAIAVMLTQAPQEASPAASRGHAAERIDRQRGGR